MREPLEPKEMLVWRCRGEMTLASRICRKNSPTADIGRGLKLWGQAGLQMDIGVICAEVNVNPMQETDISGEEKMECEGQTGEAWGFVADFKSLGTSLEIQQLRLHTPSAEGPCLIPNQGIRSHRLKSLHAPAKTQCS